MSLYVEAYGRRSIFAHVMCYCLVIASRPASRPTVALPAQGVARTSSTPPPASARRLSQSSAVALSEHNAFCMYATEIILRQACTKSAYYY